MNMKRFLIFDFGASNGRACIAHYDGKKFAMDVIHKFDNIPVMAAGTLYWDILRLNNDLKTGIQMAARKYPDIISMAVDAWGADFGLIDKNGKLISNPIHYRDHGRFAVVDELFGLMSRRELFDLTGGLVIPGISSVFAMYGLKKRADTQYVHADAFLMMPDLFNYFLTGNKCNEYTEATTSVLLNQQTGLWEKRILERLGLCPDLFCALVEPGTAIGNLQKNITEELEIRPIPVIAPAAHDTASAIAGFPIIDQRRNSLLISMGTWAILAQETPRPVINDLVFETDFANEGGVEGSNMLLISMTGLWIIQQCMQKWKREYGEDFSWKDVDKSFPSAAAFKTIVNISDPAFVPATSDMNETLRKYCQERNIAVPQSVGEIARTLYESLVFKIKHKLMDLENITAKKIDHIHIVGGGSNNSLFCQWLSDSTGLPLDAGPSETASIGNLLMQLKAAGEIKDLQEGRRLTYRSSCLACYEPKEAQKAVWESNYEKYLNVLSSNP